VRVLALSDFDAQQVARQGSAGVTYARMLRGGGFSSGCCTSPWAGV